ncbi:hypothetical protein BDV96DRAFT_196551 [Lophiotrema nucula]|uniref:Uncharacterized protein n=1 Tax=Lophiotrema nucula TaxID=690887 RepID=A0A6A5YU28_9PLEO|nr:hypothetical protein BDV96DRAFT_196551 [Lophiotrema nucula]
MSSRIGALVASCISLRPTDSLAHMTSFAWVRYIPRHPSLFTHLHFIPANHIYPASIRTPAFLTDTLAIFHVQRGQTISQPCTHDVLGYASVRGLPRITVVIFVGARCGNMRGVWRLRISLFSCWMLGLDYRDRDKPARTHYPSRRLES